MTDFPPQRIHFSALKRMELSPAHYRAGIVEPSGGTPQMDFGSLVHALVLGGEVITYDGDRRGSSWAAFQALVDGAPFFVFDGAHRGKAWERAKEDAAGRVIVTSADVEAASVGRAIQAARRARGAYDAPLVTSAEVRRAERAAEAVRACEPATALLVGAKEVRLEWEAMGFACAGTLDVLGAGFVTDLKTSASSEPSWFTRQADRLAYHAQLSWYAFGAREAGFDVRECYAVAVETRPPFAVTPMRVTPATLREGEKRWRLWLERLASCTEADEWPAYVQSVVDLDVTETVELVWGDEGDDNGEAAA